MHREDPVLAVQERQLIAATVHAVTQKLALHAQLIAALALAQAHNVLHAQLILIALRA